ncbi:SGNH/GDSL hydrolase family protein [Falsibacillus albus]|uniref:Hydrolase n=1 Tax=Falsibacillus albus TaxID=2478915 RepID=A0A3L7K0L1_9BACI|nr:SGNH/GDSL hydrolase family protein [Falsibacillus albus]RLQ96310.1 hydrolase [Falsibacillus albus]
MIFKPNDRLLFIGDSITESGRFQDGDGIGNGYVRMIRNYLIAEYGVLELEVLNKGVSANRVTDLAERWKEDVIAMKPDWVSISIGINDVWRQLDSPYIDQVSVEKFEAIYRGLLRETQEKTCAGLILMEPTVIMENIHSPGNKMLKGYTSSIHKLANEYNAILIPTHQKFLKRISKNEELQLTTDGVHMTKDGNRLMAETWLDTVLAFS